MSFPDNLAIKFITDSFSTENNIASVINKVKFTIKLVNQDIKLITTVPNICIYCFPIEIISERFCCNVDWI